jgi:hypothetical protein
MKKTFEPEVSQDPQLDEVTISDEKGYGLEISFLNKEQVPALIARMKTFYKSENLEKKLNFSIQENPALGSVILTGNLPDALAFLNARGFISKQLYDHINSDGEVKGMLQRCHDFKIPEERLDTAQAMQRFQQRMAASNSTSPRIPSQDVFIKDLRALPLPDQLQVLRDLATKLQPDFNITVQPTAPELKVK